MGAVVIWILIAIGVCLFDLVTSAFIFVWFAVGALGAIVATLLGASFSIQLLVFVVVSIIALAIGYPLVKKKYKENITRTPLMEEGYLGKTFTAEEDILETARIKVGGIYWTGVNRGSKISKGQKFIIKSIEGNKFIIEEYKGE